MYRLLSYNLITSSIFFLLSLNCLLFSGCTKEHGDSTENTSRTDISKQWKVDENGGVIKSLSDGQWQRQTFTKTELNFFSALDTVSVAGTSLPASINTRYSYPYPNPFSFSHAMRFECEPDFNSKLILKFAIVDSVMKPVCIVATTLSFINGIAHVAFAPSITAGKYRVYYTFSAAGNAHFFQSWGNIEKKL